MATSTQDLDTALCVITKLIAQQLPDSDKLRAGLIAASEELISDNQSAAVLLGRLASMVQATQSLTASKA